MKPSVTLITDGSANNLDGRGGWACIVRSPTSLVELTGFESKTTSNRMEMIPAIEGLRFITVPSDISLVSDSSYLLNAIKNRWFERWLVEAQIGNRTKPRPNLDLWQQLGGLLQYHNVLPVKVKGHTGDYWNERADKLAAHARVHEVRIKNVLQDWVEGSRCDALRPSGRQCVLHQGHAAPHYYTHRTGKSGIGTYGEETVLVRD